MKNSNGPNRFSGWDRSLFLGLEMLGSTRQMAYRIKGTRRASPAAND
jgi:hypothetical protein